MKILVANVGSTSFKYSLFDMTDTGETRLAAGNVQRIGDDLSPYRMESCGVKREGSLNVPDHAAAVQLTFDILTEPGYGCLSSVSEVAAIGFKTVHSSRYHNIHLVTDDVLDSMEELNYLMPAHNPPYIMAMRMIRGRFPEIPQVAAFETDFHTTIPDRNRYYGVPLEWAQEHSILRYGFHGASHRYVSQRTAELLGVEPQNNLRIISCHLGGSSSLCAIRGGKSVAASMGSSAQTGLLQTYRVGDFDPFVLPFLMKRLNMSLEGILQQLGCNSGLAGLSGMWSGYFPDVVAAAQRGDDRAQLALNVFVGDIRRYLGAFLVELGGLDGLVFTAGIGENNPQIRAEVCRGLESFGIRLNETKNDTAVAVETAIHDTASPVQIWVIPTNEELVVARQTREMLTSTTHTLTFSPVS